MVILVVLPRAEFVVEDLGVVDEDAIEEAVELFGRAVHRRYDLDDPTVLNICMMAASLSTDVLAADDLRDYVVGEVRTLETALVGRLQHADR